MKRTEEETKRELENLYKDSFRRAKTEKSDYHIGKAQGTNEAVGAIYLWLYGGNEMYRLWQEALHDDEN